MKKKFSAGFLFPLTLLLMLVAALSIPIFQAPPVGKVLDPFEGYMQNAGQNQFAGNAQDLKIPGLTANVQISFDERQVPHIFAENDHDLFLAQGYMTAHFRIWQMDFLSYASGGRLSEIFGSAYLAYDRSTRRLGIMDAAKRSLAVIEQDPETKAVLDAYTAGVNAFIAQMDYRDMPLEYKLFGYQPEEWTPLKSVLIMKYMAQTLTGYDEDMSMTNALLALGEEDFNALYPAFPARLEPIVPLDSAGRAQANVASKAPAYLNNSFMMTDGLLSDRSYNPRLGSNNWVVNGSKTKSGNPILCNDPHLELTFPSVWLEMQLHGPTSNVYGVTIPGTPAIIIGFNEKIAWGVTNGATDVKDWYKLRINEEYTHYQLGDEWLPLELRIEEIAVKSELAFQDTVYWTKHGPIVNDMNFSSNASTTNYALRWELHTASNEFKTFVSLNRATNIDEFKAAIAHFSCPIQNFVFASSNNDIAIWHQGSLPKKWKGQGRFILDGTDEDHLYSEYMEQEEMPHAINPEQGFLFSANQTPTKPDSTTHFNGFYDVSRSYRIAELLAQGKDFDAEDMKAMQLDNYNVLAAEALPIMLSQLDRSALSEDELALVDKLKAWDFTCGKENTIAPAFELWWEEFNALAWDEVDAFKFALARPKPYTTIELMATRPDFIYFDLKSTPEKEDSRAIAQQSFQLAAKAYNGGKDNGTWGEVNKININHLSQLEAFGRMDLPSNGHAESLNAMHNSWGPSWRMVVELGDEPKAWGIYPGGQSGDANSSNYDAFVDDWNQGQYYSLLFYTTADAAKEAGTHTLIFH